MRTLFNKAWKLQSKFIRLRDTDWRGWGNCCTCNKKVKFEQAHAGHYHHRYLDFEDDNVHLQCNGCNTYKNGALDQYALFLTRKYGNGILENLQQRLNKHKQKFDRTGKKYTLEELEQIIDELNKKIDEVESKNGRA